MTSTLQIFETTKAHMGDLIALREASGRELQEGEIEQPGWEFRFAEYIRMRQCEGELRCFAARKGEEIVGMAMASVVSDYRWAVFLQQRGYINTVYVKPEYRRTGIARALMLAAMEWLQRRGCESVRLRPSSQGEPLYRSMGFRESGELQLDLQNVSGET